MDSKGKAKMRESGEMDNEGKTKKQKLGTAENSPLASTIGGEYEVFLSFTTNDTRKSFTDYLYNDLVEAEIRTYLDDHELRVGEEIGPELMNAIEESKICIPIISQNYASSNWCLLELAQMVRCRKKILPIFYNVAPCDVLNQTGSYEEAFRQHKEDFDEKTVQEWREALREVGKLKGWELEKKTGGYEGELVKIVVGEVLLELKKNYMVITDNLVGIHHHIEEMNRLLKMDSNDVRIVGIYGMGGLGKTTIAKYVFNELSSCFDCCCFLADVREKSQQFNGLVNLKKKLDSKIRKGGKFLNIANDDEGIDTIKDMACKKKILIVLDDVDNKFQFAKLVGRCNRFGSGSRIIVTTRNKEVLDVIKVDVTYEPHLMESEHALQLFSKHAFRSDFPPEDYLSLSRKVVSTTGKLPLALEIIGSHLFGKCDNIWEETLEKLGNIQDDQVHKKLRISYDALELQEKQIFLDIACFFIGENTTFPFYMWSDCQYYPTSGINTLILKSLVKIGDDNEFIMHDPLRDLGREIVRRENTEDPGMRSRLWIYKEALDVLKDKMGTRNVKALSLQEYSEEHSFTNDESGKQPNQEYSERHSFRNDEFRKLKNLRFFRVNRTVLNGDFENLLSQLRWLQWRMCTDKSKPTNFHLEKLVILDLRHSWITEDWEGWSQIKMAKELKVLHLSYCRGLTITPDLSNLAMLKRLDLRECNNLVEFRGLTGLKSLEILDISRCTSLKKLLDLSNLEMLKRLDLSACDKLVEFGSLTGLKFLEILDMRCCTSLNGLPDLSNLKNLVNLKICGCKKLTEIRGLEELKSSTLLDISGCEIIEKDVDFDADSHYCYWRKVKFASRLPKEHIE